MIKLKIDKFVCSDCYFFCDVELVKVRFLIAQLIYFIVFKDEHKITLLFLRCFNVD